MNRKRALFFSKDEIEPPPDFNHSSLKKGGEAIGGLFNG